ncbi:trxB2 domain protein [Bordetella holmesii 41130]|nr:trxB2 domain protein [Bordetella holmesii 41130]
MGGLTADNPFADDWIVAAPGRTGQQIAGQIAESLARARVPLQLNAAAREVRPCKGGIELSVAGAAPPCVGGAWSLPAAFVLADCRASRRRPDGLVS